MPKDKNRRRVPDPPCETRYRLFARDGRPAFGLTTTYRGGLAVDPLPGSLGLPGGEREELAAQLAGLLPGLTHDAAYRALWQARAGTHTH